jgi:hypothetical protein
MTIAFMSIVAAVIIEWISRRVGLWLLPILLFVGFGSVWQWYLSEMRGAGDLRFYAAVQVYSALVLLVAPLFPQRYTRTYAPCPVVPMPGEQSRPYKERVEDTTRIGSRDSPIAVPSPCKPLKTGIELRAYIRNVLGSSIGATRFLISSVRVLKSSTKAGDFTPVLAKYSKSFSLIDYVSVGVDRMQRTFEPMKAGRGLAEK